MLQVVTQLIWLVVFNDPNSTHRTQKRKMCALLKPGYVPVSNDGWTRLMSLSVVKIALGHIVLIMVSSSCSRDSGLLF